MKKILMFSVLASTAAFTACGETTKTTTAPAEQPKNVVQTLSSKQEFSILVEAVTAADLATTLSGAGPFTVFAPTNDAFAALLTELGVSKADLLANKPLLTDVLTYHVVAGNVASQQALSLAGKATASVAGGVFKIAQVGSSLTLVDERNRSASITSVDLKAENGVIHVIDKVILPGDKDIVATAQANPDFSILVEAVVAADLVGTLSSAGPFTVFAPTNTAFANLLAELGISKDALLADTALLDRVLKYHVIGARVLAAEVPVGQAIDTVETGIFTVNSSLVIVDQRDRLSNIGTTDIMTKNGVIHVVDKVLLPAAE